jgi:hypothetical protein
LGKSGPVLSGDVGRLCSAGYYVDRILGNMANFEPMDAE